MTIAVRPAEQPPQALLDAPLGVHVDVRGRLVEHQDPRVGDQRARERDELALAGRELHAALADLGVVAVLAARDELVARRPRAPPRSTSSSRRVAAGRRRCCRGSCPLNRKPSCGTIPICERSDALGDVAQVVPVDEHAARRRVVEARHELGERRLAGAGRADQRHGLPGRHRQVDVRAAPTVVLGRRVGERHVVEARSRRARAAARSRPARRRGRAPRRAARRSCRAPPCRTGRSCRAARAAGSGRRSSFSAAMKPTSTPIVTSPVDHLVAAVEQDRRPSPRADSSSTAGKYAALR